MFNRVFLEGSKQKLAYKNFEWNKFIIKFKRAIKVYVGLTSFR